MHNWYCVYNDQTYGPFGESQLREMFANSTLTPETYVWSSAPGEAGKGWQKAAETEIAYLFQTQARAITPPYPVPQTIPAIFVKSEKKPRKRSSNSGDFIAALSGIAWIIAFFIPRGFFNQSYYSLAMSGDQDALSVLVFGIIILALAFIFSALKAPSWLRIVYLIPTGLIILGILIIYVEPDFMEQEAMYELQSLERDVMDVGREIEFAIKAGQWRELSCLLLDTGSFIGTAIAGLVGIFQ